MLVQEIIKVVENTYLNELVNSLYEKNSFAEDDSFLVVYDSLNPSQIIYFEFVEKDKPKVDFIQGIKEINTTNIHEIAFYIRYKKTIPQHSFEKSPVDIFLTDTNNYLVFHHQLENVFCVLVPFFKTDAVHLRKSLYKKEPWAIEKINSILVTEKLSLLELIKQRSITNLEGIYTVEANYIQAFMIYEYFNFTAYANPLIP